MFKSLRQAINQVLEKEQFDPSFWGIFVNPFYFARKGLFVCISELSSQIHGKTLDVGCGQKPYEKLFNTASYTGLELDTPTNRESKKADFFYDGKDFPFPDSDFDSVIANEVFEHVFNPSDFLNEINRVLKPGGLLLLTVPFVWDEHEIPFDYARYTSFGLKHILKEHGFELVSQKKSVSDIRIIFQLTNAYIYKVTVTSNRYINLLLTFVLMSPFNLLGELLALVLPKNEDLYLDNIILAKKE